MQLNVIVFHRVSTSTPNCLHQLPTRNTGISSTPIPLLDFLLLSFSSRSRRAFSRCLTSDKDERGSCSGSCLTGGEGVGGIGRLEGFEDGGILGGGAARGVMSGKDLRGGLAGGGVGAFRFGSWWGGSWWIGKGVGLVAVVGGRDGIRGGGWEGRQEGASRSSSSVSDVELLAA